MYEQKRISALCSEGRNLDNFLFIFWEKRWLHKFILKFTDLYEDHLKPKLTKINYQQSSIIKLETLYFNLF